VGVFILNNLNLLRMNAHTEWSYFAQFWCNASPFRINTCKSVSKQTTLTSFRMNTYEKQAGWGVLLLTRNPMKDFYPERPSGAEGPLSHAAKCVCPTRPNVPAFNPRIAQNPVAHPLVFSITCAMPLAQLFSFDNLPFSWGGVPPILRTLRRSDVSTSPSYPPVPNRTDDYTLPHVYSRCAILPSPRLGDRPFLPPWRPL
jgi:hypothetical protein